MWGHCHMGLSSLSSLSLGITVTVHHCHWASLSLRGGKGVMKRIQSVSTTDRKVLPGEGVTVRRGGGMKMNQAATATDQMVLPGEGVKSKQLGAAKRIKARKAREHSSQRSCTSVAAKSKFK